MKLRLTCLIMATLLFSSNLLAGGRPTGPTYKKDNAVPYEAVDWPAAWIHFPGPAAGWGRALSHEISLFSPVMYGSETWLWMEVSDSTSDNAKDTFSVVITFDYDCTLDTVQFLFKELNDGDLDSVAFCGPDLSSGYGLCDSVYACDGTGWTGSTWDTVNVVPSSSISVSAGDRYSLCFICNFSDSQDDTLCCAWARARVTR